jgi:phosphonate transport system ATP-binding protein
MLAALVYWPHLHGIGQKFSHSTRIVMRNPNITIDHAALRLDGLEVAYPNGVRALARTSLSIEKGCFVVLLGSSGAGKSTLLRAVNGLVRLTAGTVTADGIDVLSNKASMRQFRRQTGMVFQQHHLIGRLSVLSNVLMGRLGYHGSLATLLPWSRQEKRMALEAIERVGLLSQALFRADQLSGGQQQRVGIARALIQKPRLLLADEPVASLDPATAENLLTLLHGICRADGLTVIVSLHQVELARNFADRIIGLNAGYVVFDGSASALGSVEEASLYKSMATPSTTDSKLIIPTAFQTQGA